MQEMITKIPVHIVSIQFEDDGNRHEYNIAETDGAFENSNIDEQIFFYGSRFTKKHIQNCIKNKPLIENEWYITEYHDTEMWNDEVQGDMN